MSNHHSTLEKPVDILIAEDSATQAQRLQYLLEQKGYNVTAAANGRLALEAARRNKPTLLISDVVMPEMDGYTLCRELKIDPYLGDVPVILVTTLSDPQDVIRGLECRADHFILKPYDENYLLGRIQFVLLNRDMIGGEQPGMGIEIFFNGRKHFITADRLQILNLLLSTYEAAIQRNRELSNTQDTLRQTNTDLQQLTRDLEDRVLQRTHELKQAYDDLRRTQQAAMQQERLRALGQMASGIAHDINNAISPIALYTEALLEREPNLSEPGRKSLVTMQRAIDDVAQTVARMREFYRPRENTESRQTNVSLNEMIQQVLDLTRARWSDQPHQRGIMIELKLALAEGLPDITGAESELRDALTNLIFNAVDAMPEGGALGIRTLCSAPQHDAEGKTTQYVQLEVSDTGIGMDEETRRRCLEPFFTTKGERGTGLGLAMVYGMAQRHNASMDIESERGKGSTFLIRFPVSAEAASPTARLPVLPASVRPLRILIVDDDAILLESLQHTLETDGHEVRPALGGQAGIDTFAAALQDQPFEVVITDLGMPYVDGRKVVESVRAASPQTPVILLTGWGQRPLADDDRPLNVDRLLSKPPRLRELRDALARCCEVGKNS